MAEKDIYKLLEEIKENQKVIIDSPCRSSKKQYSEDIRPYRTPEDTACLKTNNSNMVKRKSSASFPCRKQNMGI